MKWLFYIALPVLLLSCKKDKVEAIDLGYNYVPLIEGKTLIYQVRDIFHDVALVPANDTNFYQIKTVVGESFIDEIGDTTFKMRRFIRADETVAWAVKDVWEVKNTGVRIEIVEENKRIIDFVFAPSLTKAWNANIMNDGPERDSKFTAVHRAFSTDLFSFDSTCTVSHQDFTSFVDHNIEYDIFAKNVGKVHSVHKELTIDNFDTLDIKKGFEIEYRLIDHSN